MNKIKVGIIFGGRSGEHDVSIMSATSVMKAINKEKYEVYPVGITREGAWCYFKHVHQEINNDYFEDVDFAALLNQAEGDDYESVMMLLKRGLDVAFPVLHGPYGEDGTIQGMFEMIDLPYVGAGIAASVLCMDKVFAKRLLSLENIDQVPYQAFNAYSYKANQEKIIDDINQTLVYPVFVKPANMGSSVGISKANNTDELVEAIEEAFKHDEKVLVEQGIDCREVECAVLGSDSAKASVVGEIIPSHDFYDYEAKYFDDGNSKMVIPAAVDENVSETIRMTALAAYKALDVSGLARVDFFVEKVSNRVYLNELNTMPGFTPFSMYALLWQHSGLAYTDLIDELIGLALEDK